MDFVQAGRQRQLFDMRTEHRLGRPWTYMPADPGHGIVSVAYRGDLAAGVIEWAVRSILNGPQDDRSVSRMVASLRRGGVFYCGERVHNVDEWLEALERSLRHAFSTAGDPPDLRLKKGVEAARYLGLAVFRIGVLKAVEHDSTDDVGRKHTAVGVIEFKDKVRRLGLSGATASANVAGGADKIASLIGEEVDIGESQSGLFRLSEPPAFARGFSVQRRRSVGRGT